MNKTEAMLKVEERIGQNLEVFLYEEYHDNRKTVYQIADDLKMNRNTLNAWFYRLKIPTRSGSEAAKLRYEGTTLKDRQEITKNARKKIDEYIKNGDFWLKGRFGEDNNAKCPKARQKISEYKKRNNPMHNEEYAMKMRVSMEQVLRDRATRQELLFKEGIEGIGYLPKFQHAEYKAIIDFAFLDEKLGIEIDGEAHTKIRSVVEKDKIRDKGLKDRGWIILRFPNYRIENDINNVLDEVVRVLDDLRREDMTG